MSSDSEMDEFFDAEDSSPRKSYDLSVKSSLIAYMRKS